MSQRCNKRINATYYITENDRLLLFVVSGHVPASPAGTIDRLDVLEIVALNTVCGAVTLGDFDGDAAQVPVTFEIRNPGETAPDFGKQFRCDRGRLVTLLLEDEPSTKPSASARVGRMR